MTVEHFPHTALLALSGPDVGASWRSIKSHSPPRPRSSLQIPRRI
jgi:hypothetical protein